MRIEKRARDGILKGRISVLFRRWKRTQVVAGRRYRTVSGLIAVDAVDVVAPSRITKRDARAAGYPDVAALLSDLRGEPENPVFRLRVRAVSEADPRDLLAADDALDDTARADIDWRLARLDAAAVRAGRTPWTAETLGLIAAHPEVRAVELAEMVGRERDPFKLDVRKLKNLGLTLSLEKGYRLSPRGAAYLASGEGSPRRA